MRKTVVQQVQVWFSENSAQLTELFPDVRFRLMHAADQIQGKVTIELDGDLAAASITFWNKAEVMALILEDATKETHVLDDRELKATDDIGLLLRSYMDKLVDLINDVKKDSSD